MAEKTVTQDEFRKLFVSIKPDKKRLLNEWCVKSHGEPLGTWFAQTASDAAKVAFVGAIEEAIQEDDWNYFDGDSEVEEVETIASARSAEVEEAEPVEVEEAELQATAGGNRTDVGEDDVKAWLTENGYKTDLVRDTAIYRVTITTTVPAGINDAKELTALAIAEITKKAKEGTLIIGTGMLVDDNNDEE